MRIALVAPLVTPIAEPHLGGSQALLADIACGLAARGHDVGVYAATGSSIDGARVIDTGIEPEALASSLFRPEEGVQATDVSDQAFAHVYEQLRTEPWDVVHNHAFDAPAMKHALLDVPVVHTLHLPPDPAIASAIGRARVTGRSITIACVSRFSEHAWGTLTDVHLVLRNGVPLGPIPFVESPGSGVLFAGRFSPEKGAAEAIDIALSAGTSITLVGSAYDQRYMTERIEPHRGEPNVRILDALPRRQLWQLMARSAAVLCPVQWDEPFGLVAAEAQAAGTPVIAFARGALAEVISDGVTGALVDDVPAAVRAVEQIDRFDRAACRRHAERELSLNSTIDAHEELYDRLVGARAGMSR